MTPALPLPATSVPLGLILSNIINSGNNPLWSSGDTTNTMSSHTRPMCPSNNHAPSPWPPHPLRQHVRCWKAPLCPGIAVRSAKHFWRCRRDMEALFSVFNVSKKSVYDPPTLCNHPHQPGGPGMGRLCKCPMTKKGNFAFNGHPSLWGGMEQIEGVLTPPLHQLSCQKGQKPRQCCQAVLQCFLATMLLIGHIFAPDFSRAHPQGVHWDSLGSFKLFCAVQVGEMPVLRAFFEHAALAIVLYVI